MKEGDKMDIDKLIEAPHIVQQTVSATDEETVKNMIKLLVDKNIGQGTFVNHEGNTKFILQFRLLVQKGDEPNG